MSTAKKKAARAPNANAVFESELTIRPQAPGSPKPTGARQGRIVAAGPRSAMLARLHSLDAERERLRVTLNRAAIGLNRLQRYIGVAIRNPEQQRKCRRELVKPRAHLVAALCYWAEGDMDEAREAWALARAAMGVFAGRWRVYHEAKQAGAHGGRPSKWRPADVQRLLELAEQQRAGERGIGGRIIAAAAAQGRPIMHGDKPATARQVKTFLDRQRTRKAELQTRV